MKKYFIISTTDSITEKGNPVKTCSEKGYNSYEEAAAYVEKKKNDQIDFCDTAEEVVGVEQNFANNFEIVEIEKTAINNEEGYLVNFNNHQIPTWILETT